MPSKVGKIVVAVGVLSAAGSCAGCIALAVRPGGFSVSADARDGFQAGARTLKHPRFGLEVDSESHLEQVVSIAAPGQHVYCGTTGEATGKPVEFAMFIDGQPEPVWSKSMPFDAPAGTPFAANSIWLELDRPGRITCRVSMGEVVESATIEIRDPAVASR
jgi:hypothetical protein